jgi:hypothetical protein
MWLLRMILERKTFVTKTNSTGHLTEFVKFMVQQDSFPIYSKGTGYPQILSNQAELGTRRAAAVRFARRWGAEGGQEEGARRA